MTVIRSSIKTDGSPMKLVLFSCCCCSEFSPWSDYALFIRIRCNRLQPGEEVNQSIKGHESAWTVSNGWGQTCYQSRLIKGRLTLMIVDFNVDPSCTAFPLRVSLSFYLSEHQVFNYRVFSHVTCSVCNEYFIKRSLIIVHVIWSVRYSVNSFSTSALAKLVISFTSSKCN